MRDPVMSLLRDAVRAQITNAFEVSGHARPRAVARLVCALHPADVQRIGARLAEDALTELARRELKRRPSQHVRAQLALPGIPAALQADLPPAISVPLHDAVRDEDDEEAILYKPLARATCADIEAHLRLLARQIAADQRRLRALRELLDLALAAGARPHSRIFEVLAAAAAPQEALS
ncbi:hypothetical protein [Thauera propionica]|jgi:hypothetical protein|uniref:hypothetical protein n=1 Tax=Thauera propionica TaxID=2019431 RepID=UPI0023F571F7|nr:hypothetical protein [Thauera propionica]MDD3676779.1 hypothetical protein [Thauera propionica]